MESTPAAGPAEQATTGPAATEATAEQAASEQAEQAEQARLRLRRAPKYRAFLLTGVLVGVLVALVVVALAPDSGDGNTRSVLGYLAVSLGALGALLGGAVALLLERRRPRR